MARFSFINRIQLAPWIGGMFALAAAILVVATPHWLFQQAVAGSGLTAILPAAAPPLGVKAKILATLASMAVAGGLAWALASLAERVLERRGQTNSSNAETDLDEQEGRTLDRILADRRRPIFAEADLGAPLMSDEAAAVARDELVLETALPDDGAPLIETTGQLFEKPMQATPQGVADPDPAPAADEMRDDPALSPFTSNSGGSIEENAGDESVADLMSRLETALDRREQRLGKNAPMPGNISALRAALGLRAGG